MLLQIILLSLAAYLTGSIPTSLIIGRYYYKIDVRNFGSKNSGATNTLRVLGAKAAIPVLLIDVLKGFGATQLVWFLHNPQDDQFLHLKILFGAAAIIGHIFPIWAGFKGGKGVATLTGVIFSLSPIGGLIGMLAFILVTSISRFVSLASIVTSLLLPFIFYFILNERDLFIMIFSFSTFLLTVITHRNNIRRLLAGQESRISFQKKIPGDG
jgi:acyl phosphate:glycerol-3-phosphate acyltransferase